MTPYIFQLIKLNTLRTTLAHKVINNFWKTFFTSFTGTIGYKLVKLHFKEKNNKML